MGSTYRRKVDAGMFVRIYSVEGRRLEQSFEGFCDRIRDWSGMFVEPDGSLVWVEVVDGGRLQLDGMIYDRGESIEYLELKGSCTVDGMQRLLSALVPSVSVTSLMEPEWMEWLRIHDLESQLWIGSRELHLLCGRVVESE
jgi:hypothetical protein